MKPKRQIGISLHPALHLSFEPHNTQIDLYLAFKNPENSDSVSKFIKTVRTVAASEP